MSADALIQELREADRGVADLVVMIDATVGDELSELGRGAFALRIRAIRLALAWALSELEVPELEVAA